MTLIVAPNLQSLGSYCSQSLTHSGGDCHGAEYEVCLLPLCDLLCLSM